MEAPDAQDERIPRDYAEAAKWFRKAAEQGHAAAQTGLGFCYMRGTGVPQDQLEAVRWYRKAAEQGDAEAETYLGDAYRFGQGVAPGYAEALEWYRKAAALDEDEEPLWSLIADNPREYAEAAEKWCREAAEQGSAVAQHVLGTAYAYGHASWAYPDDAEAEHWFRKAAEQGYAAAQRSLGFICEKGRGVRQDLVAAYMWFDLAGSAEGRDSVAESMSAEQIAEAQRLAREWESKQPK